MPRASTAMEYQKASQTIRLRHPLLSIRMWDWRKGTYEVPIKLG
jgi:hypothetical protein